MNIHEYQAKELLRKFDVATLKGKVAYTSDEAIAAATEIGGSLWVVKSQIHAGGRGAGFFKNNPKGKGGVRIAQTIDHVKEHSDAMLGEILVTKQTGEEGKEVKRLFIEEGCQIERELYISMLVDRLNSCVSIIASQEGGMNIEDVAEETPEKIINIAINPITGILPHHAREVAFGLGFKGSALKEATSFVMSLYQAFMKLDASMIEINPLVETKDGHVIALDAKMNFDDNALYRQKAIEDMRDPDEENELELKAKLHDLNYISLHGNIGCMVNGAGLSMATMDIIQLKGGTPANFLDVGGGATKERVTEAFKLILSDSKVEGILVNIFGGIMRCDVIAEGIVSAASEVVIDIPLIVRLEGTNVEKGKKILEESNINIIAADDLEKAAIAVVSAVKEG